MRAVMKPICIHSHSTHTTHVHHTNVVWSKSENYFIEMHVCQIHFKACCVTLLPMTNSHLRRITWVIYFFVMMSLCFLSIQPNCKLRFLKHTDIDHKTIKSQSCIHATLLHDTWVEVSAVRAWGNLIFFPEVVILCWQTLNRTRFKW